LGVKKPDEAMYQVAIDITQHRIEESLFLDEASSIWSVPDC